ncbi:hypothetical protein GCM10027443_29810 [Pontibacter brevis]
MDIQEFNSMPLAAKVAILCMQGTFLGTCAEGEHILVLYHLGQVFIEMRYSAKLDKIVLVQSFTSHTLPEPYLDTVELPQF